MNTFDILEQRGGNKTTGKDSEVFSNITYVEFISLEYKMLLFAMVTALGVRTFIVEF